LTGRLHLHDAHGNDRTLAAIGCVTAYLFSAHTGIYHAQRMGQGKHPRPRSLTPEVVAAIAAGEVHSTVKNSC